MHCGHPKSVQAKRWPGVLLASVCAMSAVLSWPALAQTAPKPSGEMERAQRDADKVFKMILINSDAPRRKRAPDAGTAAANAVVPVAAVKVAAPAPPGNSAAATAAAMAQRADAARIDTAPPVAVVAPAAPLTTASEVATPVPMPAPVLTSAAAALAPAPLTVVAVDDEEDDDSPLVPTSQVRPSYRANVLRDLGRGSVRVKFEVQPDGSVAKQEVVNSSNRGLNSATLQAVGQWKFEPIKKPRQAEIELGFNVEQ